MSNQRWLAPFINLGHFIDHLAMLVFPTVVLALARDWQQPYSELLPLTLGGFIAFGAFALPAGWLADHWSRYRMMVVFFLGIGAAHLPPSTIRWASRCSLRRRRSSGRRSAGTGSMATSASRRQR